MILIYGPTGVGKSDVAERIAQQIGGHIVNSDMGQCYAPLSIGTAKPEYSKSSVPHHLFDWVTEPRVITVAEYRARLQEVLESIWAQNAIPILVGGSSFYISSLFFPPIIADADQVIDSSLYSPEDQRWKQLYELDPDRANQIHPNDVYRITRALDIIFSGRGKASSFQPEYKPLAPYYLGYMIRNRDELYDRIDARVDQMLQAGWIEEVNTLMNTEWEPFLLKKKIIGYDDIIHYLHGEKSKAAYAHLTATIAQKTRNYAKRQMTFARSFLAKLQQAQEHNAHVPGVIEEVNLTLLSVDLYIKELLSGSITSLCGSKR